MGARQVDALRYWDFCNYIIKIDEHHEHLKQLEKRQNEMFGG